MVLPVLTQNVALGQLTYSAPGLDPTLVTCQLAPPLAGAAELTMSPLVSPATHTVAVGQLPVDLG